MKFKVQSELMDRERLKHSRILWLYDSIFLVLQCHLFSVT